MKNLREELRIMKTLSEVALGQRAPDLVINHGKIFNVFTRELIEGESIWIKDGRIAYVGADQDPMKEEETLEIDAQGMVVIPGLIDGHTHAVCNRYGIEEFIRHLIPTGVTTVVTELMETATISGREGIEYPVKGFEGQPIRFYYTLPPVCGLTPSEEVMALTNNELSLFLKDSKCLGIGEIYWGNLFLEGEQGERLRELVAMAFKEGKVIEGHTAGASEKKLQAYTDYGFSSCHEPITEEEVLKRLRLGYWVMIREGSIRRELQGVRRIFQEKIDFRRLILCTDGVDPEDFLEEGYLEGSLRRALKLGIPPEVLYQMVTINVAEHFQLHPLLGSISPGKFADLVIIPSLKEFSPQFILCDGRIIFKDGKSLAEPQPFYFPDHMFQTVNPGNFAFPLFPSEGKIRAIELVTRLVTQERIIDLKDPRDLEDLLMILAIDRLNKGDIFLGFLKGFGLKRGAYGTTMNWDSPAMVVVGCDRVSMNTVIERLRENRGGGVYAIGREVVSEFPAPFCGLVSLKGMEQVRNEMKHLETTLRENGVRWEKPTLTVDTLTTAAIPYLRITHRGYVRIKDRKILDVKVKMEG
ncbi:MAG: adenine deaminase C-terminal domain-containing protein [Thermodesulfobacteriota bacterium]